MQEKDMTSFAPWSRVVHVKLLVNTNMNHGRREFYLILHTIFQCSYQYRILVQRSKSTFSLQLVTHEKSIAQIFTQKPHDLPVSSTITDQIFIANPYTECASTITGNLQYTLTRGILQSPGYLVLVQKCCCSSKAKFNASQDLHWFKQAQYHVNENLNGISERMCFSRYFY